jgi:hypothetical protein
MAQEVLLEFQSGKAIEWTGGSAHASGGDLQVTRGGGQAAMTQQELNGAYIGAGFRQVRGAVWNVG